MYPALNRSHEGTFRTIGFEETANGVVAPITPHPQCDQQYSRYSPRYRPRNSQRAEPQRRLGFHARKIPRRNVAKQTARLWIGARSASKGITAFLPCLRCGLQSVVFVRHPLNAIWRYFSLTPFTRPTRLLIGAPSSRG
jgi:hypothetical protein